MDVGKWVRLDSRSFLLPGTPQLVGLPRLTDLLFTSPHTAGN
jgi:hypothetical protein